MYYVALSVEQIGNLECRTKLVVLLRLDRLHTLFDRPMPDKISNRIAVDCRFREDKRCLGDEPRESCIPVDYDLHSAVLIDSLLLALRLSFPFSISPHFEICLSSLSATFHSADSTPSNIPSFSAITLSSCTRAGRSMLLYLTRQVSD